MSGISSVGSDMESTEKSVGNSLSIKTNPHKRQASAMRGFLGRLYLYTKCNESYLIMSIRFCQFGEIIFIGRFGLGQYGC